MASSKKFFFYNNFEFILNWKNFSHFLFLFLILQQKTELRITNINENRLHSNDVWLERIQQVMDLTCRSEDEVIMAIHDCDEDLNRAVNSLLEGVSSEWEVKKKKARQSSISKPVSEQPHTVNKDIDWSGISRFSSDRSAFNRGRVTHINRRCECIFHFFFFIIHLD